MRQSSCRKTTCKCGRIIKEGTVCDCRKEKRKKYLESFDNDPFLNTYKWKKKRAQIIKRDGGLCQRCLIKYNIINFEELQAHHIKSRTNYPELALEDDNLICVCKTCNLQLGTKDVLDFDKNAIIEETYNL